MNPKISKNKRAFIIVFEATIALMILFGFLFTSLEKQRQITNQNYNREDQNMMLLRYLTEYLEGKENIGELEESELNASIQDYLKDFNKEMNSRVVICNPGDSCSFEEFPREAEVSTSEFLIYTVEETKKVKIYIW